MHEIADVLFGTKKCDILHIFSIENKNYFEQNLCHTTTIGCQSKTPSATGIFLEIISLPFTFGLNFKNIYDLRPREECNTTSPANRSPPTIRRSLL
jgi:hypothetical protein